MRHTILLLLLLAAFSSAVYSENNKDTQKSIELIASDLIDGGVSANSTPTVDPLHPDIPAVPNNFSVGSPKGELTVNGVGAAQYQLAIECPYGGGLDPQISLTYNSQGNGYGLAGYGFTVTGISVITRGGKNLFYDNTIGGVTYTASDNLFLDGKRLILQSGNACQEGATYCLQGDPYTKIIAHGVYNSSMASTWFEVKTPDGKTYQYGNTISSHITYKNGNGNPRIASWYINRVDDVYGNYMTYDYTIGDLYAYLSTVTYGMNSNKSRGITNKVVFEYQGLGSTFSVFNIEDQKGKIDKCISSITTSCNDSIYRKYLLTYDSSSDQSSCKYTRLVSVQEQNGIGESLPPAGLKWNFLPSGIAGKSQIDVETKDKNRLVKEYNKNYFAVDVNGDGVSDIIRLSSVSVINGQGSQSHKTYVYISKSKVSSSGNISYEYPFIVEIPSTVSIENYTNLMGGIYPTDLDGDGYNDLIFPYFSQSSSSYWQVLFWIVYGRDAAKRISNAQLIATNLKVTKEVPLLVPFDTDGDGKDDLLCVEQSKKDGSYPAFIVRKKDDFRKDDFSITLSKDPKRLFCADYNNDGLTDIILLHEDGYKIYFNNGGTELTQQFTEDNTRTGTDLRDRWRFQQGDFDGDGLVDFVYNVTGETCLWIARNNGDGTFSFTKSDNIGIADQGSNKDNDKYSIHVWDIDHDGRADVTVCKAGYENSGFPSYKTVFTTTQVRWLNSDGTTLRLMKNIAKNREEDALERYLFTGDFDGDGHMELANYGSDLTSNDNTFTEDKINVYRNLPDMTQTGKISQITDGFGNSSEVSYLPATNPLVYTKSESDGQISEYPVNTYTLPISVVRNVKASNGIAGAQTSEYGYKDLKIHMAGAGMLGFSGTTVTNNTTGEQTVSEVIRYDNMRWIPVETKVTKNLGGKTSETISQTTIADVDSTYFAYESTSVMTDVDGHTVTTTSHYDTEKGVLLDRTIENDGGDMYKKVSYSIFQNISGIWLPRIMSTKQKHTDDTSLHSTITRYYYDNKGNVTTTKRYYTTSQLLTTASTYDVYGNCLTSKTIGKDVKSIKEYNEYDPSGRFVVKSYQDPAAAVNTFTYDIFGNVLTESDATDTSNILTTQNTYDKWGRLIASKAADGTETTYTTGWGNSNDKKYYVLKTKSNTPWELTWYDSAGHEVLQQSFGPKSVLVSKATEYNEKGQVVNVTKVNGKLSISESFTYDELGRLETDKFSSGKEISYSYGDRSVTTTTAGRSCTKTTDAWGNLLTSTDQAGNEVRYVYYSNGKPASVTTNGSTVSMKYDLAGNQISMTDPDAGTTTYEYAADGTLLKQKDARGIETVNTYDDLGRLSKVLIGSKTIEYTYGTSGNENLRLTKKTMDGNSVEYKNFDKYGRPLKEIRNIVGKGCYEFNYQYDDRNRLEKTIYPGNLEVTYSYDDYGFKNQTTANGEVIYSLKTYNGLTTETAFNELLSIGRIKDANGYESKAKLLKGFLLNKNIQGNGYEDDCSSVSIEDEKRGIPRPELLIGENIDWHDVNFDPLTGNLLARQRKDHHVEVFGYDDLDRLKSVSTSTASSVSETGTLTEVMGITYSPNGNILSKTGVGNYTYNSTIQPHAVMSVDNTEGVIPTDALITDFNDLGKIQDIEDEDSSRRIDFIYGPDLQRWYTSMTKDGHEERTTIYLDNYEKITENGITREFYYLDGGVIVIKQNNEFKPYLAFTDNLGSILSVVDENGDFVFKASYDAWGIQTDSINAIGLHRGYTGHEMLNEFGIINMNGRLYDPVLGRFFSPDNYVQLPDFSQSYNRYSYCLNNPLKYTDPSGELFGIDDLVLLGVAYSAYTNAMMAIGNGQNAWKAAGLSLLSSAASFGIGQAFGAVGNVGKELLRAGAHGVSSGVINVLDGGDFTSGFASGAVASGIGSLCQGTSMNQGLKILVSAAAGGIAAWVTGGDFLQGALNGMNIAILNHGMHEGNGSITYKHDDAGNIYGDIPEVVCTPVGTSSDIVAVAATINTVGNIMCQEVRTGTNGKVYYRHSNGKIFYGNQYVKTRAIKAAIPAKYANIGGAFLNTLVQTPEVLLALDNYGPQSHEFRRSVAVACGRILGAEIGQYAGRIGVGACAGLTASYFSLGTMAGPAFVGGEIVGSLVGGWVGSELGGWTAGLLYDYSF